MQMDGMFDTMQFVLQFGCGIYLIMMFFNLKGLKKLPENRILVPNGKEASKCRDAEGYIEAMRPRLLILGILLLVFSLVLLAESELHWNLPILDVLLLALPLAAMGWYVVEYHKISAKHWK